MPVQVVPMAGGVGAEIRGVDLAEDPDTAAFAAIEGALHAHGMIFFRRQRLAPDVQERFTRRLGELEVPVLEQYTVPGHRNVLILSNIVENGRPIGIVDAGQFWHSDSTYRPEPARCSVLHAIEVPTENGRALGDTRFVRTDTAYQRLDPALRERLRGLRAVHSFAHPYKTTYERPAAEGGGKRDPLTDEQRSRVPDSIHPVIRTHPVTGRQCLYVNEGLTAGFVGMDADEGGELLARLCALCTPDDAIHRHHWQVGDVVIWDNCMTQHSATGDYTWPQHRRRMHRTTVRGTVPF